MQPKDEFLIKTIITYCNEISLAMEEYSIDEEKVKNSSTMRAVLAFFVQQIGETANKLSDEFKDTHPEVEWKAIIGFRHRIVHAYGEIIPDILWDTVQNNIPELKEFCANLINN